MKQIIFIIIGIFFLILGFIGLLLPVIPQVPFLAAGLLFLAGGSKRVQRRIFSSKIYRRHLKEHVDGSKFLTRVVRRIAGYTEEQ